MRRCWGSGWARDVPFEVAHAAADRPAGSADRSRDPPRRGTKGEWLMKEISRRATTWRRAGEPLVAGPGRDELVDEGAGIGLRERGAGGAQVAEPAEAVEGFAPGLAQRHEIEGGAAARRERAAGEDEEAGIDVRRDGRVGGAQILRREEQARRHRRADADAPRAIWPRRARPASWRASPYSRQRSGPHSTCAPRPDSSGSVAFDFSPIG